MPVIEVQTDDRRWLDLSTNRLTGAELPTEEEIETRFSGSGQRPKP